jgi:hypothetical protein
VHGEIPCQVELDPMRAPRGIHVFTQSEGAVCSDGVAPSVTMIDQRTDERVGMPGRLHSSLDCDRAHHVAQRIPTKLRFGNGYFLRESTAAESVAHRTIVIDTPRIHSTRIAPAAE